MNQHKLLFWSITVALAGFLFGFDTVVISGADQALQEMWQSSSLFHGVVVMSSALWGTVIGALFGSIPTDRLGRKKTLILIGFLYIIGAAGSALVSDPWLFAAFRFLGGLAWALRPLPHRLMCLKSRRPTNAAAWWRCINSISCLAF